MTSKKVIIKNIKINSEIKEKLSKRGLFELDSISTVFVDEEAVKDIKILRFKLPNSKYIRIPVRHFTEDFIKVINKSKDQFYSLLLGVRDAVIQGMFYNEWYSYGNFTQAFNLDLKLSM
jgi:hypothetical protein